jgi:hypothetical protein
MVVHGLFVPGACATRQPAGMGTWQVCEGSPLAMPKLQACSVVAGKSDGIWATASGAWKSRPDNNKTQPTIGPEQVKRIQEW